MIAPVVPEDDLEDVPEIIRDYKRNSTTYGITPELHQGLLQAYYASISYMDAQVGRVLDALEESGVAESFTISRKIQVNSITWPRTLNMPPSSSG